MRYFYALAISTIWLAFSFPAHAQSNNPLEWLDKMSRASRELDYFGVFSYEYGVNNQTLRVVHVVRDGLEYERLIHMDGDQREIIRKGHPVDCVHSGARLIRSDSVQIRRNLADRFGGDYQELQSYYQISMVGQERVAGRLAVQIQMRANDDYRHSYILSIDANTGLLLRSIMLDSQGGILERFQFSLLAAGIPIEAEMLQAESGNPVIVQEGRHNSPQTNSAQNEKDRLIDHLNFSWLPRGFIRVEELNDSAETVSYSDGLAMFSVYLEKLTTGQNIDGWAQQGGTVALSRRLDAPLKDIAMTIVGEMPMLSIERISASASVVLPVNEPAKSNK